MLIAGYQKLSLLDYPKTPCAIIFTQGCSFRCAFCHNPELIPMEGVTILNHEDIIAELEKRRKMVDAVTITGGEPTLQKDLPEFMAKLKERGFKVKLDTNGVTPAMVKKVIDEKLADYFAMDLKQTWAKYDEVVRVGAPGLIERVKETFGLIQGSGIDHEFRTTILPHSHTAEDFMEMVGYLKEGEKYFIQDIRFNITLEPNLKREKFFDLKTLIFDLRSRYPSLLIEKH